MTTVLYAERGSVEQVRQTTVERPSGSPRRAGSRLPGRLLREASFGRQLLVLLLVLLPIAAGVAWRLPVTYPEGDFVLNVLDVARTGHVSSTFTPDAYPYFAGVAYKLAGVRGFLLEQVVVYLLLGGAVLWLVRLLAGGRGAVLICSVLICLHPDILSSIPRVWDTELTSLLLMGFAVLCVLIFREPSIGLLLAVSTVWGVGLSVRPNFALLILPVVYLLVRQRLWVVKTLGVAAWAVVVALCVNRLAHGSFYVAQNGPYNFFAGANPYTQAALLRLYNAESSVPQALAALGLHVSYDYDLALSSTYTHEGLLFVRSHPLTWLWLGVIKLITLLRANTKSHAMWTPGWLVQMGTTVCVPVWGGAVVWVRRIEPVDKLVMLVEASYILPFLLTNSDPRFRPPLDVLVLAHAASMILRQLAQNRDAGRPGSMSPMQTNPSI